MSRFSSSDQEFVIKTAERLIESDNPAAHLAGRIAHLEPAGFDESGVLVIPHTVWAFAHEALQTGMHEEQGLRGPISVERSPRRLRMDAMLGALEDGDGRVTVYSAIRSLGLTGKSPTYGETWINVTRTSEGCAASDCDDASGAQHLNVADGMVTGAKLGLLTTDDNKFSQMIASFADIPDKGLGARLNAVARRGLELGLRENPWGLS